MQNITDVEIFAVFGRGEIIDVAHWLEAFRKKDNIQLDYDVTLNQSCYFQERQLPNIKNLISKALVGFDLPDNLLPFQFEMLRADRSDGSSMIMTESNTLLDSIQRNIAAQLC